jgi:hypothetical protein
MAQTMYEHVNKWKEKEIVVYIYTMEYYSAIKNNDMWFESK